MSFRRRTIECCVGLAWGGVFEQIDQNQQEPPVTPGLEELSPALTCFARLFFVNKYSIAATAEASPPLEPVLSIPLEEAEGLIPSEERDGFLDRLLHGQPQVRRCFGVG